ncbi:MAG: phage holin family protein [Motiliproteus sp.]
MDIEKQFTDYGWITYLWVFAISAWGGLTSYIQKVKTGRVDKFFIMELIGEMCVSAFVGVVTFWLCELSEFPSLLTVALVAMSGHMGVRAIALIEDLIKVRLGARPVDQPGE